MDSMLSTIAFALLIGAQFLAAVVLISKRRTIYAEPAEHVVHREAPRSRQFDEVDEKQPAKAA
jgi:hypothetical protein